MYYSETKVIMGGLAHVPILIFIVNFIKGKFESLASKVVKVKKEVPKLKVVEIKEGDKFLAENFPDIGIGIATPVTQKTYKYQKPIP